MASNFSSLRSSRKTALGKLAEEAKKESQKAGQDDRFWKLTVDAKTKIGSARLRFLPAPKDEELPWVRLFSHGFKGPGGAWYIENCPTSLPGQRTCPVCKENNKLWNADENKDSPLKKIARDRKRKLSFISNVLVVDDPAKPENNGKVFLFRYGAKIHDKLKEVIEPEFPDVTPLNPFDMWEGADFKLRSRDYQGYQNYDKSEFADPSELCPGDDDAKEALWAKQFPLLPIVAEDQFKSYDDLEKHLNSVLNGATGKQTAEDAIKSEKAAESESLVEEVQKVVDVEKTRKPGGSKRPVAKPTPAPEPAAPEDDEIQKFFGSLEDE